MTSLEAVVPAGIDDLARPSGGNTYDRRILDGLRDLGWSVREHPLSGAWPHPQPEDHASAGAVLSGLEDGATVLIDGIIGSAIPEVLAAQADRLRLVLLLHLPAHTPLELEALRAARVIVATSRWTRDWVGALDATLADRVRVVTPGVDAAPWLPGSPEGRHLLCVGAVIPRKGQDLLLEALTAIADEPWTCACVGSLDVEPEFASRLLGGAERAGLRDRVTFAGPLIGVDLDRAYAEADLLVQPSRAETYGMVVTEALARGLPVIPTDVGGLPEALGHAGDGSLPGRLVPAEDPRALADALLGWLGDPVMRQRWRASARSRREHLNGWHETAQALAQAIAGAAGA